MKNIQEIARKLKELYQRYIDKDLPAMEQIEALAWAADVPVELVMELLNGTIPEPDRQDAQPAETAPGEGDRQKELESQIEKLEQEIARLTKCLDEQEEAHAKKVAQMADEVMEAIQSAESAHKENDTLIETYAAQLQDMKEQKDVAERKARALKTAMKNKDTQGQAVLSYGSEKNLYMEEIPGILLDILSEALMNLPENSRRYVIVKDILEANKDRGQIQKERIETIKYLFKHSKTLDERAISRLKDLGIETTKTSKHFLLTLGGDKRFSATTSSSPSDCRTSANIASAVIKNMF